MIKRQHLESHFFSEAEALRETLDASFKNTYTDRISWQYFCDPRKYAYLRTLPQRVFPKAIFERFIHHLRGWCIENLGLVPIGLPYLHLMINGCKLELHSDFHNGAWGYVYSLTRWNERKFSGGETLLLRDGVPSYKKHHVHGEVLYELIPAQFNQLLLFDDRIVHATPMIEGSMDPIEGRIAMVGHIRSASPVITGALQAATARRVILEALPQVRDRARVFKEVQGTIAYRLEISPSGEVASSAVLTDNLVTPVTGYAPSNEVNAVKAVIEQTILGLKFPSASGSSVITMSILIPVPDLRTIEIVSESAASASAALEWAAARLAEDSAGTDLRGVWEGDTLYVEEPVAGTVRVENGRMVALFDPPMWVPSQRESFSRGIQSWLGAAIGGVGGRRLNTP